MVRVWRNAASIAADEGGGCDGEMLVAAAILHDCVHVEKTSPLRPQASRLAAAQARGVVLALGWGGLRAEALGHVVEAHSFSAGVEPRTREAEVFQDADRLDGLGAVGVARCFAVSGRLDRALYDVFDFGGERRQLDDHAFTVDHFEKKLYKLAPLFRTRSGRRMAEQRTELMRAFVAALRAESVRGAA
jgi:uncharacterized protein